MKIRVLFAGLWLLCSLACTKDDDGPPEPSKPLIGLGGCAYHLNGVLIETDVCAKYDPVYPNRFGIVLDTTYNKEVTEHLILLGIPLRVGTFPIRHVTARYHTDWALCNMYWFPAQGTPLDLIDGAHVDTTKSTNFIELIRYDSVAHTVEGKFNMTLSKRYAFPGPYITTREFKYEEGVFHVKVY
jgi:hypothetical protein